MKKPMRILVFDPSREAGEELAGRIRGTYGKVFGEAVFSYHNPEDVFTVPLPEHPLAAFFTLTTMYDVEAARKYNALHRGIPLVVVSDTKEFGTVSWSTGACYYLLRPIDEEHFRRGMEKMVDAHHDYLMSRSEYRQQA